MGTELNPLFSSRIGIFMIEHANGGVATVDILMNVHYCSLFYTSLSVATFLEEGLVTRKIQSAFGNINDCLPEHPCIHNSEAPKMFNILIL